MSAPSSALTARLALGVLALLTLYGVGANIFLKVGGLEKILNQKPERLHVEIGSAFTPLPGWVWVEDLTFRSQSHTIQLEFKVDEAKLWISLFGLARHTLHIRSAEGEGFALRSRPRVDPGDPLPEGSEAWPEIPGVLNPPDPDPEAIYPAPDPLMVHLDDITLHGVRDLWVNEVRFLGMGELTGDLDLLPRAHIGTEGIALTIASGEITLNNEPALSEVTGDLAVTLKEMGLKDGSAEDALSGLSGDVTLQGQVGNADFLNYYLRQTPWILLHGTAGPLQAELHIEEGRLAPGSTLTLIPGEISADLGDYHIKGRGEAHLKVDAADPPVGTLSVSLEDYEVQRDGQKRPALRGKGFFVTATSEELHMAEAFTPVEVALRIPDARADDISLFADYLPKDTGATLKGGTGTLKADFKAKSADQTGEGTIVLKGDEVHIRSGDLRLMGDVDGTVRLKVPDLTKGRFNIGGTELSLTDIGVTKSAEAPPEDRAWWGKVNISGGHMTVGAPIFLEAQGTASLKNSAPIVAVFASQRDLPKGTENILTREDIEATFALAMGDGLVWLDPLDIEGKDFTVKTRIKRVGETSKGALFIKTGGGFSIGIGLDGEEREVKLFNTKEWYESRPMLGAR